MDRVWLVLRFLRAIKDNDLDLHMSSLQEMCHLFFAYDHQNYARYAAIYLVLLLNIDETHPGAENILRNKGFSVSRSKVSASRNAVDITIDRQSIDMQSQAVESLDLAEMWLHIIDGV